jgi:type IV pilus assembly protein PilA
MLTRRALLALPLALSLAACAPTTGAAAVAPIVASPAVASDARAVVVPAAAAASSALLAAVPANATLVARLDGRVLRAAPIFANAMAAIQAFPMIQARLEDFNGRCGVNLLEAVDEVVIARTGPGDDEDVTLARVRAEDGAVLRCVLSLLHGKAAMIGADPAVRIDAASVAVVVDGITILGSEGNVGAAIKAVRSHEVALPKPARALDLGPSTVAAFSLSGPGFGGISSGTGVLEMDDHHLAIRATGGLDSAAEATALEQQARGAIDRASADLGAAPDGAGEALQGYLSRVHVSAEGSRVRAEMQLDGGVEAQAKLVGTLSAVGIYGVRQYLAQAKLAEAKNAVGAISRGLAVYMEREDATGKRATRFPPSAPPTPAKVPSGTKFATDASTWSHPTWKALRFEMDMPVYYSYEIVTSKDGRTATVRAHGDLDGDGKLSTIERTLTLGKDGTVVMDPKLVLHDELE